MGNDAVVVWRSASWLVMVRLLAYPLDEVKRYWQWLTFLASHDDRVMALLQAASRLQAARNLSVWKR
jgi:hypothetical protein